MSKNCGEQMSAKARPADTAGASLNEEFHQIDRNFIFAKI